MSSLLVTNNDTVISLSCLKQQNTTRVFRIEGHAVEVLGAVRNLLLQGWKLAADPLAGHYIRLNPFHTILLKKGEERQCQYKDLARIDRALELWERSGESLNVRDQWKTDYQSIDCSLTASMLESEEGER